MLRGQRFWEADSGFGEVSSYGVPNDSGLGLHPTDASGEAMSLESQERTQSQPDVVALRAGRAALAPLDPGALLDPPVVVLDRPTILGELQPAQVRHRQVVGRPVRD